MMIMELAARQALPEQKKGKGKLKSFKEAANIILECVMGEAQLSKEQLRCKPFEKYQEGIITEILRCGKGWIEGPLVDDRARQQQEYTAIADKRQSYEGTIINCKAVSVRNASAVERSLTLDATTYDDKEMIIVCHCNDTLENYLLFHAAMVNAQEKMRNVIVFSQEGVVQAVIQQKFGLFDMQHSINKDSIRRC